VVVYVYAPIRVIEVKAYSHQSYPITYELTTDTSAQSNEFAIDQVTGLVDLLRQLDYERDLHRYHLKVKAVENGRHPRSSTVNVRHPIVVTCRLLFLGQYCSSVVTCHYFSCVVTCHYYSCGVTCHYFSCVVTCHYYSCVVTCHYCSSVVTCHYCSSVVTCHY